MNPEAALPQSSSNPAKDGVYRHRAEHGVGPRSGWIYPSLIGCSSFCGIRPIGSVVSADGHRHGVSDLEFPLADPAQRGRHSRKLGRGRTSANKKHGKRLRSDIERANRGDVKLSLHRRNKQSMGAEKHQRLGHRPVTFRRNVRKKQAGDFNQPAGELPESGGILPE